MSVSDDQTRLDGKNGGSPGAQLALVAAILDVQRGDGLLDELARLIAETPGVDTVLIARRLSRTSSIVQVIAEWPDVEGRQNAEIDLRGTELGRSVASGEIVSGNSSIPINREILSGCADACGNWNALALAGADGGVVGFLFIGGGSATLPDPDSDVVVRAAVVRAGCELERRTLEGVLSDNQTRYRTLFEETGDAVFPMLMTDDGPIFADCNSSALRIFGRVREDLLGKSPADPSLSPATQPDGRSSEEIAKTAVLAALNGEPQHFDWLHYGADGTHMYSEVSLRRLDLDEGVFIQAITRDITSRKLAEQSMIDSEVRYRTLFQTAGNAISLMRFAENGPVIVECNSSAEEMFGRTKEDLVGRSPSDPELSAAIQEDGCSSIDVAKGFIQAAMEGIPQSFEWTHRRADGSPLYADVTLNRLELADGVYIQAIARDITDKRKAIEFERQLLNELDHRVHNNMSIILSLIRITSRSCASQEELEDKLTWRVRAMAIAQKGLASCNWRGVELLQIVEETLQPHLDIAGDRFSMDGPAVDLPAGVSGPFSIAMNELASNAVNHGALASAAGTIDLRWSIAGEVVRVEWIEAGGPGADASPAIEPAHGLGLICGLIERQLGGKFTCAASSDGFRVCLEIPLVERTYTTG